LTLATRAQTYYPLLAVQSSLIHKESRIWLLPNWHTQRFKPLRFYLPADDTGVRPRKSHNDYENDTLIHNTC
ncbi:MAG: hypothetical protein WAU92_20405, partial [Candidatus Sulfotelmatobacter sp.]